MTTHPTPKLNPRSAELVAFLTGGKKSPKYRNKRITVDGINFASQREAKRYSELKVMERAGRITLLQLQPRFPLKVNDVLVTTYVADFQYSTADHGGGIGKMIVEDSKGFKTPEYKLKAKLFLAIHGYPIVEV